MAFCDPKRKREDDPSIQRAGPLTRSNFDTNNAIPDAASGAAHLGLRRLSEREAAAYLGPVAVRTLQDWRCKGLGPAYSKLGRRVCYDVADLDAFLATARIEPKATFAANDGEG